MNDKEGRNVMFYLMMYSTGERGNRSRRELEIFLPGNISVIIPICICNQIPNISYKNFLKY